MQWFKHSTNASRELPVRRIRKDLGFHGLGVFWCIMERVVANEGLIDVEELEREFASRYFPKSKIRRLLNDYGLFEIDCNNDVHLADKNASKMSVDTTENAPAYNIDDHILLEEDKKEKREDKKKTSKKKLTEHSMAVLLREAATEEERNFYERMQQEYPNICTMTEPLTFAQMQRLLHDHPKAQVIEVLNDMENLPRLSQRYLSANLTCRSWIRIHNK